MFFCLLSMFVSFVLHHIRVRSFQTTRNILPFKRNYLVLLVGLFFHMHEQLNIFNRTLCICSFSIYDLLPLTICSFLLFLPLSLCSPLTSRSITHYLSFCLSLTEFRSLPSPSVHDFCAISGVSVSISLWNGKTTYHTST